MATNRYTDKEGTWKVLIFECGISVCISFYLFICWPHCGACRMLVPQPGIRPKHPELEVQSLNYLTTREVTISFKFTIPGRTCHCSSSFHLWENDVTCPHWGTDLGTSEHRRKGWECTWEAGGRGMASFTSGSHVAGGWRIKHLAEAGNLVGEAEGGWTLMAVSWDLVRCLPAVRTHRHGSRLEILLLLISIWIRVKQKRMQASFVFVPRGKAVQRVLMTQASSARSPALCVSTLRRVRLFATPARLATPGSSVPEFAETEYWVGCCALFLGLFPARVEQVSRIAGKFSTIWSPRKLPTPKPWLPLSPPEELSLILFWSPQLNVKGNKGKLISAWGGGS